MAELFISYSHVDRQSVSLIAGGLRQDGYDVWWDRDLLAHQQFDVEIEAALHRSACAIVAWSAAARNSLWVRAEATEALESGKLVQLTIDGAKPPLPFTMIHILDLSAEGHSFGAEAWITLRNAIQAVVTGQRPMAGAPPLRERGLAGLERSVVAGAASLALIIVAAGLVGLGAGGLSSTTVVGWMTLATFLAALLAFSQILAKVIATALASR